MTVLITGATAGFGKAIAELFAKNGHNLIITGRRNDRLTKLSRELIQQYKVKVLTLCFDISVRKQVEEAIESISPEWKKIDILINNAGLAAGLGPIQGGDFNDWETMIDTNIKGVLYITRLIAPEMIQQKRGHIINIGSIAGKEAYQNGNVYCATKHAIDALSKAMRIDMLPFGIKVSQVCPGMAETEFSLVRFHGNKEKASSVYAGLQPLIAEDIAETVYWIATRPAHVNINDIIIMPTAQANTTSVIRKNN